MLDKLVLHIPFFSEHVVLLSNDQSHMPLSSLPTVNRENLIAGNVVLNDDGSTSVGILKTKFESLPSSHTGMAFKIFENGMNCDPFVMIKCSPVKLLQGHNLYGFDCMRKAAENMLAFMFNTFPELSQMLDVRNTHVSEFDIKYSVLIPNPENKKLFLDHLKNITKGQTKSGNSYETTAYWGTKNTRLTKQKAYSKIEEMLNSIPSLRKKGFEKSADLVETLSKTEWAKSSVGFEATFHKTYLERRAIPTKLIDLLKYLEENENTYVDLWKESFKNIFDAMSGQTMTKMNDEIIYKNIYDGFHTVSEKTGKVGSVKVNRLFAFYQSIKALGFVHLKSITSSSAFSRNMIDLCTCGISLSTLQNLKKDAGKVVFQVSRFIQVDFDRQCPPDYKMPPDLYAA